MPVEESVTSAKPDSHESHDVADWVASYVQMSQLFEQPVVTIIRRLLSLIRCNVMHTWHMRNKLKVAESVMSSTSGLIIAISSHHRQDVVIVMTGTTLQYSDLYPLSMLGQCHLCSCNSDNLKGCFKRARCC